MITSKEFTPLRKKTMKELAPEFVCIKNVYVRELPSSQIHCISFTPYRRDNLYYIDLGIHYHYMPSFKSYGHNHKAKHPEPETCAINSRWFVDGRSTYEYGETIEDSKTKLVSHIESCLEVFREFDAKWGNGEALLEILTPAIMQKDALDFTRILESTDMNEQSKIDADLAIRKIFLKLKVLVGPSCVMLAFIAKQFGHTDLKREYLQILRMPRLSQILYPLFWKK